MTLANISPMQRYYALNQEVLRNRRGLPAGDRHQGESGSSAPGAQGRDDRSGNHVTADPSSAGNPERRALLQRGPYPVGANGRALRQLPYLFGHELWEESRIPLFEQAVAVPPPSTTGEAHLIERVTFGTGYAVDSLMEVFQENRDSFPRRCCHCSTRNTATN